MRKGYLFSGGSVFLACLPGLDLGAEPPPKGLYRVPPPPGARVPYSVVFFFTAEEVISINKTLTTKKRGECVTFEGEHNYQTNDTFKWKRDTITMVSGGRISISGDRGKTIEIRRLEESDTAWYSAMIHTARGLEITRHRLVVRGRYFILVSRGRAPFGQHQESRPLAPHGLNESACLSHARAMEVYL